MKDTFLAWDIGMMTCNLFFKAIILFVVSGSSGSFNAYIQSEVFQLLAEGSLLQSPFCYILKISFFDFVAVKCAFEVSILLLEKVKYL